MTLGAPIDMARYIERSEFLMIFAKFAQKFSHEIPSASAAYSLYHGAWKYDFDRKTPQDIIEVIDSDQRPKWCAETFEGFVGSSVLELGPADGYNTAALERLGAKVTAIEGNVDAFLRCLILKNALGLQSQFQLGDFTRAFEDSRRVDTIYASGVLYHIQDPIGFLDMAGRKAKNLFLWTHFFDEENIKNIDHELKGFSDHITQARQYKGRNYTYHTKTYDLEHVGGDGYIGGLNATANRLKRDDLFAAVEAAGYTIRQTYEDPYRKGVLAAVNILASQTHRA